MPIPHAELLGIAFSIITVCIAAICHYFGRKPRGCLNPEKFQEFRLIRKAPVSHNVAKFTFALPTPTSVLGLPVGSYIICSEGREVSRPYTPITLDSDVGYFELVIKMYPLGKMSHHFRDMQERDLLAVKGPKERFKYKPNQVRAFGMIAGGTGITPMFQVTRAILENPKDKTNIQLIYGNTTSDDILLKEELDNIARNFPSRFQVYYVLSKCPPEAWNGGVGYISKQTIQNHCPAPAPDIQILRCGPPGMNKAVAACLNALGYTSNMQFEF
ncbi:hypothetical protein K2173_008873 [Erythroxylum novogranatense]|uniref:NADH-cytochrome b5 reductase n=1 Tax=Erythroxylum novogranatense TaxID=1862640 RepID=A0AAV8U9D1_9ROSI|nr:hypothetical protein K2173_008873 [Erythroxylum novogranatense]